MNYPPVSPAVERTFAVRRVPVMAAAPGEVREWADRVLGEWLPTSARDDLRTVVSELVTNSVQAGATEIVALLEWHRRSGTVEFAVWDDAPGVPERREPDFAAERGRGLHLVAELSVKWGHHRLRNGTGKVVWALLEASGTDGIPEGENE